jgi:formylmethanofuran dehydrogenase subunit E
MPIRNFDRYYDPPERVCTCDGCGEEKHEDDLEEINGKWLCVECAEKEEDCQPRSDHKSAT